MSALDAALVHQGRAAFNRGEWFVAHELWERAWLVAVAPDKRCLQGLIQVCAALLKLERQRIDLYTSLVTRALEKLADVPASFAGLDVGGLREALLRGPPLGPLRL